MDYEVVYNVGLLDDVHNYFPALLYDTGRFQNVTQIFHYIRHQMNERFNLFTYGASLAAARNPPQTTHEPPLTPVSMRQRRSHADSLSAANVLLGFLNMGDIVGAAAPSAAALRQPDLWASFRDPVIVRPTAQAIATGTESVLGSSLEDNTNCAICQEIIGTADSATRLRACGHVYHVGCIEQWFLRSVYCPSCRHDIRIQATTPAFVTEIPSSSSAAAAAAPSSSTSS